MTDIRYLNVDLDLESPKPLDAVLAGFGDAVCILHHDHVGELYFATCEISTSGYDDRPDETISMFLDLVDGLSSDARSAWDACSKRSFNIGFNSGLQPHVLQTSIPPRMIERLAAAGAHVDITIYSVDMSSHG